MLSLDKMRDQVNRAYREAVECPCYKKKRLLLKKFYAINSQYNEHKLWIKTMASN